SLAISLMQRPPNKIHGGKNVASTPAQTAEAGPPRERPACIVAHTDAPPTRAMKVFATRTRLWPVVAPSAEATLSKQPSRPGSSHERAPSWNSHARKP